MSTTFLNAKKIISILNSVSSYKIDGRNYIIYPFSDNNNTESILTLKKLYFTSTNIERNNPFSNTYTLDSSYLKSINYFESDSKFIMCLYNYNQYG